MSASRAREFEAAIRAGHVVLFPSDTVYGLAVDPTRADALYALKGRPADKPAALMYFDLDTALAGVPAPSAAVMARLLPGPITVVLAGGRGIRVVDVPVLAGARGPVLQSSANPSGAPDACRLEDVDPAIRAGVGLEIDGGELPGVASTVLDLRRYDSTGEWSVLREGAVSVSDLAAALGGGPAERKQRC
jgi:L-threonylcarbamoyladenylate synthase